jgi:hypothetical protein
MLVADLTPLHKTRIASGKFKCNPLSGSHADISCREIYNLISGFCFA